MFFNEFAVGKFRY